MFLLVQSPILEVLSVPFETFNCVCFDSLISTVKVITSENVVFDKLNASLEKYFESILTIQFCIFVIHFTFIE